MRAAAKNYDEPGHIQDELIRKAKLPAKFFRLWQTEHAATTLIPQRCASDRAGTLSSWLAVTPVAAKIPAPSPKLNFAPMRGIAKP